MTRLAIPRRLLELCVAAADAALPHEEGGILLGSRDGRGDRRAARLADIQVEALILELRDMVAARGDRPTGSLARLIDYDRRHHANLVETLAAWLDAFGDVTRAAESLYVHPNTFRYRLRRLAEVGEIDLDDPDQRFVAMLQLRVLTPRTD